MSTAPIDDWYWDDDEGCVMARDVAEKRDGEPVEVDFTEPHIGRLGAAAPDMARALNAACMALDGRPCTSAFRADVLGLVRAALTKAGVPLP